MVVHSLSKRNQKKAVYMVTYLILLRHTSRPCSWRHRWDRSVHNGSTHGRISWFSFFFFFFFFTNRSINRADKYCVILVYCFLFRLYWWSVELLRFRPSLNAGQCSPNAPYFRWDTLLWFNIYVGHRMYWRICQQARGSSQTKWASPPVIRRYYVRTCLPNSLCWLSDVEGSDDARRLGRKSRRHWHHYVTRRTPGK